MKLVVLSYSHHGRGMARTAHGLGHDIVGVMDGDAGPRQQLAEEFQCRGFESAGACLDACLPDAVRILEIQDAVYAHARQGVMTHGPHPMGAQGL